MKKKNKKKTNNNNKKKKRKQKTNKQENSILKCQRLISLRKHAYLNILKILPPKNENFQINNCDIFHISSQNIDCGYSLEMPRWGSSNEYPQSMFLSRNKKNNVYPVNPSFTM